MRVLGQPALVIHVRAYRETSMIVRLFTPEHGLVAGVFKGVRGRRSTRIAALQPFNEVRVSWLGAANLLTLTDIELEQRRMLHGQQLAAGFYVLELLVRLLHERDAHPSLYRLSQAVLSAMVDGLPLAPLLRRFEHELLSELGFGVDFSCDQDGDPLDPEQRYKLEAGESFVVIPGGGYSGAELLAIGVDDYRLGTVRHSARLLFREMLDTHLGTKPLASRSLLASVGS